VGNTGYLVPPSNAEALAEAIGKLGNMTGPDVDFSAAARDRIVSHFSVERMVARFEEHFAAVLRARNSAS
jgi:glycosyltransferase involved in cell wall biosynthesis